MSETKYSCDRCGKHTFNEDKVCNHCRHIESVEAQVDMMKLNRGYSS